MRHENSVSSNELIKVELPGSMIWKADVSSVSPLSERMTRPIPGHIAILKNW